MAEYIPGPQGPQGPQGSQGPQGPKGEDGVADWSAIEDNIRSSEEEAENSITCTTDGIEIKNGDTTFTMQLDEGQDGDCLITTGNTIKLSALPEIAALSSTGIKTNAVKCEDSILRLTANSQEYTLDLSGEEPGAPLIKDGTTIKFGVSVVHNVVVDVALPEDFSAAQANTIYFLYDPTISYGSDGLIIIDT